MTILRDGNLVLRPLVHSDITDRYHAWLVDPEVNLRSRRHGQTYTRRDMEDFLAPPVPTIGF